MKKMISKIKNLNWKVKMFICIVSSIIFILGYNLMLNYSDYKEDNYDYSQIYSTNGIVTNAYWKDDYFY